MPSRSPHYTGFLAVFFALVLAPQSGRADLLWDWSIDFAELIFRRWRFDLAVQALVR